MAVFRRHRFGQKIENGAYEQHHRDAYILYVYTAEVQVRRLCAEKGRHRFVKKRPNGAYLDGELMESSSMIRKY